MDVSKNKSATLFSKLLNGKDEDIENSNLIGFVEGEGDIEKGYALVTSASYGNAVMYSFYNSMRNFTNARRIYNFVKNEPAGTAYFYRLEDREACVEHYDKILNKVEKHIPGLVIASTKETIKEKLDELRNIIIDSKTLQSIVNDLLQAGIVEGIGDFLFQNTEVNNDDIGRCLEPIFKNLHDLIGDAKFFNLSTDIFKDIKETSVFYSPGVQHCWGTNLAWILAHIQKGSSFSIHSSLNSNLMMDEDNKKYCAFAREVCVAIKAGYTLHKKGEIVILSPDSLKIDFLQSRDTTGELGNGINPSFDEIEQIYRHLSGLDWNTESEFTCKYNFAEDQVILQMGIRKEDSIQQSKEEGKRLTGKRLFRH